MKKLIKIILAAVVIVVAFVAIIFVGSNQADDSKTTLSIISTNFPGYDFARAIVKRTADSDSASANDNKTNTGPNVDIKMLLKPGAESHNYEPTPQDIKDIKNSDLFIYVGGDSDAWIADILDDLDVTKTKIIKLMDLVNLVNEETVEGMEAEDNEENEENVTNENSREESESDEHVWTSPTNAIAIIKKLAAAIVKLDPSNKDFYETNANNYINELTTIDQQIRNLVATAKRTELIFGDRFPFRYFTDAYGLTYYAAFLGCSEQTEASAKTISFLIDKVKADHVPVIFHIELSNQKIASTIANETGVKVLELHSAHNISQQDFDAGLTYVDIMKNNITNVNEALN